MIKLTTAVYPGPGDPIWLNAQHIISIEETTLPPEQTCTRISTLRGVYEVAESMEIVLEAASAAAAAGQNKSLA